MFLPKLNLQFFSADGGGEFGGYDPMSAYEGVQSEPQVQPEGQGEPVQEETPLLDFGGRKLPANDELVGLHKDYTEQQRYITMLQDQVNTYKQMTQNFQPQGEPQGQPQAQAEPDMSQMENWNEEDWAVFYDRAPVKIAEIARREAEKLVKQQLADIQPIIQEREWNNEIQRMFDSYPDFGQFVDDVNQLVGMDPRYAQKGGLEDAYFRAKATKLTAQPQPQQMAQDPQVQQQVLNNYFQSKQQVNQTLPTAMGRGAGGFTPQTPDAAPTTIKEASRAFLKQLGMR
jgi:hypothetical protein